MKELRTRTRGAGQNVAQGVDCGRAVVSLDKRQTFVDGDSVTQQPLPQALHARGGSKRVGGEVTDGSIAGAEPVSAVSRIY